jgi:hypothetical protein
MFRVSLSVLASQAWREKYDAPRAMTTGGCEMTRRSAFWAVAAVSVLLSGCQTQPPAPSPSAEGPTVIETPAIVGDTVSASPLESDEWVVAARAADLGSLLAMNSADFTIEQYTSTRSELTAKDEFLAWRGANVGSENAPFMWPGPSVLLPLSVDVDDDGATVSFCNGSNYWADGDSALVDGRVTDFRMVRDGSRILISYRSVSTTVCDATAAAIGRFDPVPAQLGPLEESDVRPPLGMD